MKLQARSAFGNIDVSGAARPGVTATDRAGLAVVRIAARKGRAGELAGRVREHFGIELRSGPTRIEANGLAIVGIGVETWLVVAEREPEEIVRSLRAALDNVATVSDQSGGHAVLRLTGPRIREALAKFLAIDLHAREFQPGAAATTLASHIPLTLWRLNDGVEGHPVFEFLVQRSLADSFYHVLIESTAT
jgi:methylglutamate dehydrogenase subunit D